MNVLCRYSGGIILDSGQDLLLELQGKMKMLDTALREFGKRGRDYANAEQEYRCALAEKILVERDKGVPVTIISDICRGDRKIAKLKFERDVAESVYDAAREACNCYKLEIRILEGQVNREWGRNDT
jgi:hypothetical protein